MPYAMSVPDIRRQRGQSWGHRTLCQYRTSRSTRIAAYTRSVPHIAPQKANRALLQRHSKPQHDLSVPAISHSKPLQ
eukprot:3662494-Rhodomonas_salina.1